MRKRDDGLDAAHPRCPVCLGSGEPDAIIQAWVCGQCGAPFLTQPSVTRMYSSGMSSSSA